MQWLLALLVSGMAHAALAHDGVAHSTRDAAAAHGAEGEGSEVPFPIEITPRFRLIDQMGRSVTEADFAGRPMVVFFGYANCDSICPVALPRVGAALDMLGDHAKEIAPIMITVDPARDTAEALAKKLPEHHPRLIGLTGDEAALAAARAAFQVEVKQVAETADGAPIFAHGSFVYLVGRDGRVRSVLPPVLGPERVAELIRKHL